MGGPTRRRAAVRAARGRHTVCQRSDGEGARPSPRPPGSSAPLLPAAHGPRLHGYATEFAESSCESTLADCASSNAWLFRHGGQMPSASSLSRAPFCEGFVSSQDSSSKSFPLKKDVFILSWHLSDAATSLEIILPTVCSHLRESALLGTHPVSSPPISACDAESQKMPPFWPSSERELLPKSTDSSSCALLIWTGSQSGAAFASAAS